MAFTIYQVDAFTNSLFSGNPAAIVPLEKWLDDALLQKIALENNLAETAFIVPASNGIDFDLRWFTPTVEVSLCGHATLATAHVLFYELGFDKDIIRFNSKSGLLIVSKYDDLLTLDFPKDEPIPVEISIEAEASLGIQPLEAFIAKMGYTFLLESEDQIKNLKPDLSLIKKIPGVGVIVTARGSKVDFVSRFFAPQSGIDEDPVTGSAHTILAPLWEKKLGKSQLKALQLSPRGGELWLQTKADRVLISGKSVLYMKGQLFL